jgi:hypothetical protein
MGGRSWNWDLRNKMRANKVAITRAQRDLTPRMRERQFLMPDGPRDYDEDMPRGWPHSKRKSVAARAARSRGGQIAARLRDYENRPKPSLPKLKFLGDK